MSDIDKDVKVTDSPVDGEQNLDTLLSLSSDKFTKERKVIKVRDIGLSEPTKVGRSETIIGLTKSIAELGVLTPIHVMTVEQYDEEDEEDEDAYKYMLLEGLRRLYGALKAGVDEIEAVIWDFKDKDLGRQIALPLSLMLNRHQKRNWKEVWELYQILELQSSISPGSLEYLLQLEAGDAMKLKDCMLCDYEEVKEMVLGGEKTLEQAYKQLQKLRKEENKLAKEEETGISDSVEGAEDIVSKKEVPMLSDDEVADILEMGNSISDENIDEMSFEDLDRSEEVRGVEVQEVGKRHRVDPAIKQATFQRDKFRCVCCNTGGTAFLTTLIYHHKVPVSDGGADTVDNGLTLCDSCHQVLHTAQIGKLAVTKEMFEEYDEKEQRRLKLILKYANIAIEADKRRGKKRDQVAKENPILHRMPGQDLKETVQAYNNTVVDEQKKIEESKEPSTMEDKDA